MNKKITHQKILYDEAAKAFEKIYKKEIKESVEKTFLPKNQNETLSKNSI